jgi:shikimate dehydrogenase
MAERPFAEVIGDPVAHSKSPLIHRHWLQALGLDRDYRATQVSTPDLASFFAERRADPRWRGCNVTAPHKQSVLAFTDRLDPAAAAIGAVNCIVRDGAALVGYNTDVDGVAEAASAVDLRGSKAIVIGAGGGARASVRALLAREPASIVVLARDPRRAAALGAGSPIVGVERLSNAETFKNAAFVINATPMGMTHADAMPDALLDALALAAPGATAFDMVYEPLRTPFLQAAEAAGLRTVDGLTMLIGQARRAFRHFFGADPPEADAELRRLLTGPRLPDEPVWG